MNRSKDCGDIINSFKGMNHSVQVKDKHFTSESYSDMQVVQEERNLKIKKILKIKIMDTSK